MNVSELTASIKPVMGAKGPISRQIAECFVSKFHDFSIHEELGDGTYAKVYRVTTRIEGFAYKIFKGKELLASQKVLTLSAKNLRGEWLGFLLDHKNICRSRYAIALRNRSREVEVIDAQAVQNYCADLSTLGRKQYVLLGVLMDYYPSAVDICELSCKVPDVCKVAYGIINGVKEMHNQGIMHRDLKPENVLLTEEGEPIIVDFGFAISIPESGKRDSIVGTLDYLTPRIAAAFYNGRKKVEYTKKRDHYAIAKILFILAFGKFPWKEGREKQTALALERGKNGIGDYRVLKKLDDQNLATLICLLGKYYEDERINLERALELPYFDEVRESLPSSPRHERSVPLQPE
ncbi:MAG: hypothetical protein ChlgKO_00750 [Chlamydiales bacterium]